MPVATNSAQQLRLRINDKPRRQVFNLYGDGTASAFELGTLPGGIVSAQGAGGQPSAFIALPTPTGWSATGVTFTYYPGIVTFSGVISAQSAVQCVYWHGVFSEDEIDYMTANYGDLNSCTVEAITTLMGDYSKRAQWAGGGVEYNDAATFKNLKEWRDTLRSAMTVEQGPQGGFESWADNQQNYPGNNYTPWG